MGIINQRMSKDDISLAQWALVEEIRAGKWKTLDFPRIARNDFDLNGIEFVNTLFEVPTATYLSELKNNAANNGMSMILIMVDDEGDGCTDSKGEQIQFGINHRKWVDTAHFLGCQAIRTNCRGRLDISKSDALNFAADSYYPLLEYAQPAKIRILIENHGGLSNDPDWMVDLIRKIGHPLLGTYPDWREPATDFDNYAYLSKTIPYAGGMSYRNQPTDELTEKMISLCRNSGYRGWYGIESSGRQAIKKGIELLRKHLLI
jgi:L-ribulose-5-phosphate 3-epimerase